jgi:hypothetical protein
MRVAFPIIAFRKRKTSRQPPCNDFPRQRRSDNASVEGCLKQREPDLVVSIAYQ